MLKTVNLYISDTCFNMFEGFFKIGMVKDVARSSRASISAHAAITCSNSEMKTGKVVLLLKYFLKKLLKLSGLCVVGSSAVKTSLKYTGTHLCRTLLETGAIGFHPDRIYQGSSSNLIQIFSCFSLINAHFKFLQKKHIQNIH